MKPYLPFLICTCLLAAHSAAQTQPTTSSGIGIPAAQAPVSVAAPAQPSGTSAPSQVTDPKAAALVASAAAAMGGVQSLAVQDFTATGDITYYWAGTEEKGSATVRGKGLNELRFDSVLANGTRSWAVNAGSGSLRDTNGKITSIPFHNAITLGNLIFPAARLQSLSIDNTASLTYGGTSSIENSSFEHLGVHKNLFQKDPDGSGNRLMDADFYFEPSTHLLVGIHDQTHPTRSMTVDVAHSVYFGDYRPVNGIMVPFSVSEYVGGQKVWSLQITDIKFDTGLSDSDFQLQ